LERSVKAKAAAPKCNEGGQRITPGYQRSKLRLGKPPRIFDPEYSGKIISASRRLCIKMKRCLMR
jgi:hypothetical protein